MRTITETINLYKFEELSDKAKDKVRYGLMSEYFWMNEAINTLTTCADKLGFKLYNYSIDLDQVGRSYVKLENIRDLDLNEIESIAKDMLEMKYTGYCLEYDCGEEILRSIACGVKDLEEIVKHGLYGIIEGASKDYQGQFEDDYIIDHCEANDYEFTENGELY